MKRIKIMMAISLVAAIMFSMVFSAGVQAASAPNANLMTKLTNPNVKVFMWSEPTANDKAAINYFEKTTGGKANISIIPWSDLEIKTIAALGAGSPPDTIYIHSGAFPRYAIKKLAVPIDNYFNINDPILDKNAISVYSWVGKHYGVINNAGASAVLMWYNKTMFEDNGLDTPLDYFNKGQWNFDTFRKLAMQLTQDTNGDGKTDQWGYASWMYEVFALANGGKFVNYNPKGIISFAMNDPKTQAGLQFMQNGYYKDKFIMPDGNVKCYSDFTAGKIAMMAERTYIAEWYLKGKVKFQWDFVPFPTGPNNTTKRIPGDVSVWGITNGAKNPQGAAAYIYCTQKYYQSQNNKQRAKFFTKDQMKRLDDASKRIVLPMYNGIGNWWNAQWPFWGEIFEGKPVASTIAKYKPTFQKEIDITLKDTKLPEIKPFKAIPVIDFEKDMDSIIGKGWWGTDSVALTKDSNEVVSGKQSMKVVTTKGSEWQMLFTTDPAKAAMPANHTYKISFDYKILSDSASDGYYFICIRPKNNVADGAVNFGWVTINGKKAGDTGKLEATIAIDKESTDNCIVVGGYKAGSISVDNIKITE